LASLIGVQLPIIISCITANRFPQMRQEGWKMSNQGTRLKGVSDNRSLHLLFIEKFILFRNKLKN